MDQKALQGDNFPQELCTKPQALIGASGLDVLNNATHKLIWETFCNTRKSEKVTVTYKLYGNTHEFPVIKPKRNSYDWYIPKGILKRNWMNKHLNEIPALMVAFYELDWHDPHWNEKMIECASRVQSMRAALEGRSTRLAIVLIQNTIPLPAGEDTQAQDRAINLCASCELTANSLFVLPIGDHLHGYATRLENAFFEVAQLYYQTEIKGVRSHKDHLNKNSHQFLLVRHQFKMGFLYEMKLDLHTAHKHYTHAYNNLLEIRIVDTNALEIRTIAGFINYKLCHLMFALNLPRDAISQFKAHIDRYRLRIGFHQLAFEHHAWLSKQYAIFGEIFDEAVKFGLPAVQTQHPGIYYQQAAQYAILRKRACQELCSNIIAYPQPDPLEGANYLEFYGQRPWRRGKLTGEAPDPQLENSGIQALQFLEKQINHSNAIVSLYGQAITQYKNYKCPRTRRHLVLQMADEYYNSHDFGKALTLLTHMLFDFRAENWWTLLTDILQKALRCAFLTANIQDYLTLTLEILAKKSLLSFDEKIRIQENLKRILQKQIPFGDPKLSPDVIQNALIQWQPIFTPHSMHFTIDLHTIQSCIETKVRFVQNRFEIDQKVTVEVYVRVSTPLPVIFERISIEISGTTIFEVKIDESRIEIEPNEVKRFIVQFQPEPNDVHKEIRIAAINLQIGDLSQCTLNLKFVPNDNQIVNELLHFKYTNETFDFDNVKMQISATIIPRRSKLRLKLEHAPPALLAEWFPIKFTICNEEEHEISNVQAVIHLIEEENVNTIEFTTNPNGLPDKLPLKLNMGETIAKKGLAIGLFYLQGQKVDAYNLDLKISYTLNNTKPVISIKTEQIRVTVVKAFDIETKFLSGLMLEVSKFYVGEEIGLMPNIRCLSPWPIEIEDTRMEFALPFKSVESSVTSRLKGHLFGNKEVGAELFLGVCDKSTENDVTVGVYIVKWKRENGLSATSRLTVKGHQTEWLPLEVKMTVPAHGLVRTPLLISFHLFNRSEQLLELDVSMEASEAFMYAGYKQFSICVEPETTRTIQYNLYPLIAGSVALPKLILSIPENSTGPILRQDQLAQLVDRSLPTHLFVMPQVKGAPKLPPLATPKNLTVN